MTWGYWGLDKTAYQTSDRPGSPEDGYRFHDLHALPGIYEQPEHYFFNGMAFGADEIVDQMHAARHNPDHPVTVYRAVPPGVAGINTGDWVTPSSEYAHQHADTNGGEVIAAQVPAQHLSLGGDSLYEFGYHGPHVQPHTAAVEADVAEDLRKLGVNDYGLSDDQMHTVHVDAAQQIMTRAGLAGKQFHIHDPDVTNLDGNEAYRLRRHHAAEAEGFLNKVLADNGWWGSTPSGEYNLTSWAKIHPNAWELRNASPSTLASTDGLDSIHLPGEHINMLSLLHEAAHLLTGTREGEGHGPEFQQVAHKLYHEHLGPEAAEIFRSLAPGPQGRTARLAMPSRDAYDWTVMDGKRKTDDIPEQGSFYHGSNHEHQPGDILESVRARGDQDRMDYYRNSIGAPEHADWVWMYNHPAPATKYHKNVYELEPLDEGPWVWNNILRDDGQFRPTENDQDFPRLVSPRARVVRKLSPDEHAAAAAHMADYYDKLRAERTARLAMAWDQWAPQVRNDFYQHVSPEGLGKLSRPCEAGGCSGGSSLGAYWVDHGEGKQSYLTFTHRPQEKRIDVNLLGTHEDFQGDGVAESLMRRLHEDHPGMIINPGSMTGQGRGFHDRMVEKDPAARDVLARVAAVNQDLVDRLHKQFHDWWKDTFVARHKAGAPEVRLYLKYGDPDAGPITVWPAIEAFLKDRYPAAHRGLDMGMEQAQPLMDGKGLYGDPPPAHVAPYETGPEAEAKHGYDPKEIAAGMLLLHNESSEFRGDMAQHDVNRLHDIAQKRTQMQRDYEQRNARLAMAWDQWAPKIRGGCGDGCGLHAEGRYVIPQAGAFMDYVHRAPGGKPTLHVLSIYTHPSDRGDGVAEAMIRRLMEDHPGMSIHPGTMTNDGQKFHDRMLDKEPSRRDLLATWDD